MAPYYIEDGDIYSCISKSKSNGMFDYDLLGICDCGVPFCISSYVLFVELNQINIVDWQNHTMAIIEKSGVEKFHKRLFKGYKTI